MPLSPGAGIVLEVTIKQWRRVSDPVFISFKWKWVWFGALISVRGCHTTSSWAPGSQWGEGGGVLCRTVLFLSFSLVFNLLWFSSFAMRQLANTELVNTNFMLKQEHILKPFIKSGVPFSSTNVYPTSWGVVIIARNVFLLAYVWCGFSPVVSGSLPVEMPSCLKLSSISVLQLHRHICFLKPTVYLSRKKIW